MQAPLALCVLLAGKPFFGRFSEPFSQPNILTRRRNAHAPPQLQREPHVNARVALAIEVNARPPALRTFADVAEPMGQLQIGRIIAAALGDGDDVIYTALLCIDGHAAQGAKPAGGGENAIRERSTDSVTHPGLL